MELILKGPNGAAILAICNVSCKDVAFNRCAPYSHIGYATAHGPYVLHAAAWRVLLRKIHENTIFTVQNMQNVRSSFVR